jgi:ABC-type phosphate transport system substrate-binding protein
MKSLKSKLCLVIAGLLFSVSWAGADVLVIVNSSNTLQTLTLDDINRIFLKKTKRFENGVNAEPIALAEGTKQRNAFNQKILQRDEQQLKYYWSRKMFSGGDRPPPTVASENDVITVVAEKPGGIGYVTTPPKDSRVKVVFQIKD